MVLFTHWELIKHLTLREIKARYKQSFFGFFWVILNPFFQMLIMSFVFSHIIRMPNLGVAYPVFLYVGLLPWMFFANSVGSGMNCLIENASLLNKIYFPREVLILSTLLAKAFDFGLSLIVLIAIMIFYHVPFTFFMLIAIPIFIVQFMFIFGISIILSVLNLMYRDVQYLFNLILTVWFYITPVIYATEFFPEQYRWIFKINPMSVFINAYRQVVLGQDWPNWSSLAIGVALSIGVFCLGYAFFKKSEGVFADIV
jgi:lipopolysaccharide transport system permease protein